MEPRKSTLNPYAAAYIPFSKVEKAYNSEVYGMTRQAYPSNNQTISSHSAAHPKQQQQQQQHYDTSVQSFYGSSSQNPSQFTKPTGDDDFYVHLDYLRAVFSDISDESLTDVYVANRGDIEATIEMLHELNSFTVDESSQNLPDTLGIGDVPETGSSAAASSAKPINIKSEASSSSSSKTLESDSVH